MSGGHDTTLTPEQEARFRRRRCGAFCLRAASYLVLFKLFLLGLTFTFFTLRSAQPVNLAPFQAERLLFCPKWFRGADIVASFPASEHVSVHKLRQQPKFTEPRTYELGYNVTLHHDAFTRSHVRTYHFEAQADLAVEIESDSPVHFMLVHPEHREQRRHKRNEYDTEERGRHGDRSGEHRGEHGKHERPEEPHPHPHPPPPQQPASPASGPAQHETHTRHQFRVMATRPGEYDFIFWLPKNGTSRANVQVRVKPTTRTVDFSGSCPIKSSLTSGHRHIKFRRHQEQHVFLAASPYAPSSSVVFVRLVPNGCRFASVAAVLFAILAVFRLGARFLLAHSKPHNASGSCFWSRLFKCRKSSAGYAPVPVARDNQNNNSEELNPAHRVVFYTPNTIN